MLPFLSDSFGVKTTNTSIPPVALENHTRFQTKMGKLYTRSRPKQGKTEILHALLAANPSCREALGTRTEAAWTPWCSIDEKLLHFLPFYEEKCKNNVIFCRFCLRNTYLLLLWFLRADFVAEVVGNDPRVSAILKRWPLKLNLNCTRLFTGKINIFSKILNFVWAVKELSF